jgi:hypothetical protein
MTPKHKDAPTLQEVALDAGLKAWFHRSSWSYVNANRDELRVQLMLAIKAYTAVMKDNVK